jgi:Family of unknown function (DUF6191)
MEIFQPSLRHAREERERLELTVDQPDSGAPPLGIDLDNGTARFVMPLRAAEPVPLLQEVEQDHRRGDDDSRDSEHDD